MLRDIISDLAHCQFYISQYFVELFKEESHGSFKVYLASLEYKQYFLQELHHVFFFFCLSPPAFTIIKGLPSMVWGLLQISGRESAEF
jgi:hypothetical protein